MFVWFVVSAAFAAEDCPDPSKLALEARTKMLEARQDEANDLMNQAQDGLSCGELPTPEVLAELWLSEGARRFLEDDMIAAREAFAAAHRANPAIWDPALGHQLRALYDDASIASSIPGEFYITLLPKGYRGALDGVHTDFPTPAPSGMHLVNVFDRRGGVHFGEIVYLPPGEIIEVTVEDLPAIKKPVFLIAGGVSALAAGGLAAGALLQNDAIANATAMEALEGAYTRQKVFAIGSYSLAGFAAAGLTLHVAL